MKNTLVVTIGVILLLSSGFKSSAQDDWNHIDRNHMLSEDTISRKGYTLVFLNKDANLNESVKQRLIEAFFSVYPKEAKMYNKHTLKKVVFYMDPDYKGVAATSGDIVRFNPKYFQSNPGDIDVVTHEVMHIVQAYPGNAGPGWLTEGIADYVRFKMGVDNQGAHWTLPNFSTKQSYENAYRVTARFLVWIEKNKGKGIVKQLDSDLRTRKYNAETWKQLTGKTVDELWSEYALNSAI
jgi:hypothetical protein